MERIDHLVLYTRHAELYYAYADGSGSVDDVARHAYRIRKTMIVHSYGLWCSWSASGRRSRPTIP